MVELRKITNENYEEIIKMKVHENQRNYVAPNVESLAEAWIYYEYARPLAIYNDDEPVGFIMFYWDTQERIAVIWRFMIDLEKQKHGYGKKAIELAIEMARNDGNIDVMILDYVPGNDIGRNLYYSFGFRENGEIDDGEVVMKMPLTNKPKVGIAIADDDDIDDLISLFKNEEHIPSILTNLDLFKEAIENKEIIRFTIFGDDIGFAYNDEIFIIKDNSSYYEETLLLYKEFVKR